MKTLHEHLQKLRAIPRYQHHHLLHRLHKKHHLSHKTLFYVKEYGPHAHVTKTIIKESLKILLLAALISSLGGLAIEQIRRVFLAIIPLVILLPFLNDMVGDFGTIVASRFSTMLHEGKIQGQWGENKELRTLFTQIQIVALIMAAGSSLLALAISAFSGYALDYILSVKIFIIALADVVMLVTLLFLVSIVAGLYYYNKKEDPNNFLIPISTSIADFGNMILLAFLVYLIL